jgi:hypothetical protein
MKISGRLILLAILPFVVIAGGNNEFVKYPAGYKDNFKHYSTQNRQNNEQVGDFYANDIAINSAKDGVLADGSILVMEVYKSEVGENGNRITGPDGVFKKAGLAAVAVMEKRSDWDEAYPANERTGGWGFAFYDGKGMPKENDLDCVSCHTPLSNQDHVFTLQKLTGK